MCFFADFIRQRNRIILRVIQYPQHIVEHLDMIHRRLFPKHAIGSDLKLHLGFQFLQCPAVDFILPRILSHHCRAHDNPAGLNAAPVAQGVFLNIIRFQIRQLILYACKNPCQLLFAQLFRCFQKRCAFQHVDHTDAGIQRTRRQTGFNLGMLRDPVKQKVFRLIKIARILTDQRRFGQRRPVIHAVEHECPFLVVIEHLIPIHRFHGMRRQTPFHVPRMIEHKCMRAQLPSPLHDFFPLRTLPQQFRYLLELFLRDKLPP